LLAEHLAIRLARRGVAAIDELHRRASEWFEGAGLVIEAVRHASQCGDLASAVSILQCSVPKRWKLSYVGPLRHLIDNLPMDLIVAHERLALSWHPDAGDVRATSIALPSGWNCCATAASNRLAIILPDRPGRSDALAAARRYVPGDGPDRAVQDRGRRACIRALLFNTVGVIVHSAAGRYAEAHRLLDANPSRTGDSDDDLASPSMPDARSHLSSRVG
jgi:LuxR family maltose regulon positive regulatory protein